MIPALGWLLAGEQSPLNKLQGHERSCLKVDGISDDIQDCPLTFTGTCTQVHMHIAHTK